MNDTRPSPGPPHLTGIVAACLTPFDTQGRIDWEALERQIEFILADADAITIGAVEASEYSVLSMEERRELLRRGAEIVDGRKPVVLGASSPRLRTVAELAELAGEVGADFIQVLAPSRPWGGEPDASELIRYFKAVESVSPLPIVAYHNPACGADPSVETWIRVSELAGVRAIKESSRDISKIGRMIEGVDAAGNAAYLTTMQPLLATLLMGGSGGTMPPPGSRIGSLVVAAARAGDFDRARRWQRVFNVFPARWARYGLPPVMKSAMRHFGVAIGDPLAPFQPVSDLDHDAIGRFLAATGVLDGVDVPHPAAFTP
ncbi:MAG TPA: dihydrodipicolinate synthase family protein [Acidimicrobiia bacterium]|nr:dihydrodipicolinate synthase family protein [Acidimicrobiia bacterium]